MHCGKSSGMRIVDSSRLHCVLHTDLKYYTLTLITQGPACSTHRSLFKTTLTSHSIFSLYILVYSRCVLSCNLVCIRDMFGSIQRHVVCIRVFGSIQRHGLVLFHSQQSWHVCNTPKRLQYIHLRIPLPNSSNVQAAPHVRHDSLIQEKKGSSTSIVKVLAVV